MTVALALVSALAGLIAAVTAALYNSFQIRAARRRLVDEWEARRANERAADITAQSTMAAVSEKLAQTSFAYIDRIQSDMDRMRTQHASEAQAAVHTIADLQGRVRDLQQEVQELRTQLFATMPPRENHP